MISAIMMATMLCSFSACTPDNNDGERPNDNPPIYTAPSEEDVVTTRYAGKTLFFAGGQTPLDSFLTKRFDNVTTTCDDDVEMVLLNESKASEIIADEALYAHIRHYWLQNKAIGFIKPGENAITLIHSLKSGGSHLNATAKVTEQERQYMGDLLFFITKADNKSMAYRSFDKVRTHHNSNIVINSEDGSTKSNESTEEVTTKSNDYIWGQVAEALCTWANKQFRSTTPLMANMAITRSEELTPMKQELTTGEIITLSNDYLYEFDNHYPADINCITVPVTIIIEVLGGFNDNSSEMCDVYDVVATSEVPANGPFVFNDCVFDISGLYHYKATGFGYLGPTATYRLVNEDGTAITKPTSVHEMSPIAEGSTINTAHIPSTLNFGVGLSGGGGFSGSFSASYTPPATTTTISTDDNPFDFYKESSDCVKWAYRKGKYKYYNHTWGFNGSYLDSAPEITKTFASYKQALTFKVDNSRDLQAQNIALNIDIDYSFYAEACTPWAVNQHTQYVDVASSYMVLDPVSRYFEKYTPSRYYSDANADSSSWANLQELLQGNVNYKHFCNEDLRVCARLEEELMPNAEAIWIETVESLITQYNGNAVKYEYIVGLADSNGVWLKSGLYIKDDVWSFVEDIEALREQIKAAE